MLLSCKFLSKRFFFKWIFFSTSIESQHQVTLISGLNEFMVKFAGPRESKNFDLKKKRKFYWNLFSFLAPYEGGVWNIRVDLPDKYPFKSPSIGMYINTIKKLSDKSIQLIFNNISKLQIKRQLIATYYWKYHLSNNSALWTCIHKYIIDICHHNTRCYHLHASGNKLEL
jgi:hypothetical protein